MPACNSAMRVILSRKGLDSDYGGFPSPIMPDGRILSIPIPGDSDEMCYDDVQSGIDGNSLFSWMVQLSPTIHYDGKYTSITRDTACHLDPDLMKESYRRDSDWQGCFGQSGAAQTVLEHEGIQCGDLFLFFGWYNHTRSRFSYDLWILANRFHTVSSTKYFFDTRMAELSSSYVTSTYRTAKQLYLCRKPMYNVESINYGIRCLQVI